MKLVVYDICICGYIIDYVVIQAVKASLQFFSAKIIGDVPPVFLVQWSVSYDGSFTNSKQPLVFIGVYQLLKTAKFKNAKPETCYIVFTFVAWTVS